MNIGFDGSRAFPSTSLRTGTENYSYQLLAHLAKIDKTNHYIVYVRPSFNNLDAAVQRMLVFPHNFTVRIIRWERLWTQGGLALQTFKDRLDALFVPAHTLPVIYKPNLKTVVTVHDLGAAYLPRMHQVKQRLYLNWMTNYQLKTATKLIAVSKATKDDLIKKCKIPANRIEVVYEGYDKNLFKPIKDKALINSLKQYELVAGNYFLFVGTVQPRKNLERLIKAFAKWFGRQPRSLACQRKRPAVRFHRTSDTLANARLGLAAFGGSLPSLVIAGSKGWLSDEIYSLPKKLGLEDKVKFLGYVPDENLPALYSGAKALLFPSLFEGFGLPILEAQACGCPVLTSNISSMPEVAGPASAGGAIFVNPYDIDDMVEGIRKIEGKRWRMEIIKAGYENIKKFSWEKCAEETLKVLESLL